MPGKELILENPTEFNLSHSTCTLKGERFNCCSGTNRKRAKNCSLYASNTDLLSHTLLPNMSEETYDHVSLGADRNLYDVNLSYTAKK